MFYFFYYFPLGLDVHPRRATWATWSLIAVCTVAFSMQRCAPAWFWANYSAFVFVPASPSPSSLILNAYFHGGWLHLISNMVSLAVFGPVLEDRLGSRRFLVLYHLTNILANVTQGALVLLFQPAHASYGVLGASGAIAGVLGVFCARLYFARLRVGYWAFMPLQAYTRGGATMVPVGFAVAMWLGMQLGSLLLQGEGAGAGIACGSHLGGLLAGIGLGLLLRLPAEARAEAHLGRGRRYLQSAKWYAAQGELIEYVRRQPDDDIGHLELARTYRLTGQHSLADAEYRTACRLQAAVRRMDRVETSYQEAERGNPRFALEPQSQLQLAQMLERSLKPEAAVRAYLRLADEYPCTHASPVALFRAARLAAKHGATAWRTALLDARLLEDYPDSHEAAIAGYGAVPRAAAA